MRPFVAACLAVLGLNAVVVGGPIEDLILDPSVTVFVEGGAGSGVIFVGTDGENYVLTAGHVAASLRKVRTEIQDGIEKKVIEWDEARVQKVHIENGRAVGHIEYLAEVIGYSDADHGDDLAVLRLLAKFRKTGAKPFPKLEGPGVGDAIFHCGSLAGEYAASLSDGIVAYKGRVFENKAYDQSTATAIPGSSGGGVFTRDGLYCGMITRGLRSGDNVNFFVPLRRIDAWLEKEKLAEKLGFCCLKADAACCKEGKECCKKKAAALP